jgi:hypothetical protein
VRKVGEGSNGSRREVRKREIAMKKEEEAI